MAGPLLDSKTRVPAGRPGAVPRPRLTGALAAAPRAALTVLSASAGFGKTTLLTEWLATLPVDGPDVAWLSLDARDDDPSRFWTYVLAAVRTVHPEVGGAAQALLDKGPPDEAFLTDLLNDLGDLDRDLFLVLDDYHLADGPAVTDGMVFLLDHLPPSVHIVLTTRSDPSLQLARLRARGELVELRASDLRFTTGEVAAYFAQTGGTVLDDADVAALASRTEGWIAALQLAALSLQNRPDPSAFIAGFSGDNRYIVDYLVEEVLARQTDQVRTFLLQTSILDRLTGDLCDAVTEQTGGKAMLESVGRANLFLTSLDETRTWYRYHHLFADMLQTHLRDERPDQLPDLHGRASQWFERAGETESSVGHAIAAGELDRAAELMELAMPAMLRERKEATILGLITSCHAPVNARPVLAVGFIGALMSGGEFAEARGRLRDIADVVDTMSDFRHASDPELVVIDEPERVRLPGLVELYWAALAVIDGDLVATRTHANAAIELAAPADDLTRAGAGCCQRWPRGAPVPWTKPSAPTPPAGTTCSAPGTSLTSSAARSPSPTSSSPRDTSGGRSRRTSTGSNWQPRHPGASCPGTPDMYVGMSQILLERDDLPGALRLIGKSGELGEHLGLPQNAYRWRRVLALASARQGDFAGALELVGQAQSVHRGILSRRRPAPRTECPARRCGRRASIGYGVGNANTTSALRTSSRTSTSTTTSHWLGAARPLRRRSQPARAERGNGPARATPRRSRGGGRTGSVIEILVLQSLALQRTAAGREATLGPLLRALSLAESEGYVRVFAAEGPAPARPAAATRTTAAGFGTTCAA